MAAAEDIHGEAIEKLKQIQDELEKINEKELLEIKQKHNEMSKLLYDKRNNVIESIPDFWKTAFLGHTDLRNPVMHGYSVFERVPVPGTGTRTVHLR
ncbi:protein SET-like, partial [Trifolium pratense]